jgi:hypothetical protein
MVGKEKGGGGVAEKWMFLLRGCKKVVMGRK